MITAQQARDLSEIVATNGIITEVKQMARSELWAYYYELLFRPVSNSMQTVRRMW